MENFGEYFLGALGCINMILAMRKFEIQWTFCDYVAPALEEAGETMLGKRGSFLVLVATIFILGLPIRHQLYRGDYVLPLFIFLHFMTIPYKSLGLVKAGKVDVLNIKLPPAKIEQLVDRQHFYPAYHMNKKHWLTVMLQKDADISLVQELLAESYQLVEK